jgi:hypothetical protein
MGLLHTETPLNVLSSKMPAIRHKLIRAKLNSAA